jgi:Porin subfamily
MVCTEILHNLQTSRELGAHQLQTWEIEMTNLKWLRQALLGGAALSVLATGAQADELTALKAQLEALQSRVNQLETQPAPALPAGTKLLTVHRGPGSYNQLRYERPADRVQDHQGYTIAVTPTADMPAPVSEVTVSGDIRVNLIYQTYEVDGDDDHFIDLDEDNDDDTSEYVGSDSADFDIRARGRIRVDGRTETAIGEIGGSIRVRGDSSGPTQEDAFIDLAWGYWQMTPNLQLGGGWDDDLAKVPVGVDSNMNSDPIVYKAGPTNEKYAQLRLTYNSGGFTAAVAVEHNPQDNDESGSILDPEDKGAVFPGVAGLVSFDTGSLFLVATAKWEQDEREFFTADDTTYEYADSDDDWVVGGGAILKVSDMFRIEAAATFGEGMQEFDVWSSQVGENDMEHWNASAFAVLGFAEGWGFELGGAYSSLEHEDDEAEVYDVDEDDAVGDIWSVLAALTWNPVDQLTMIWGAGYNHLEADDEAADADWWSVGMSTSWRF